VAKVLFGLFGITIGGLLLKVPYLIFITYLALTHQAMMFWPLLIYNVIFSAVILNNIYQSAAKAGFLG
jgi:uncharacterized membrane protein